MVGRMLLAAMVVVALVGCSKSPEERLVLHKAKGASYLQEGKVDEALLELRGALKIAPKDKEALAQIGEAFVRKGQLREAYQAFNQLVQVDPQDYAAQVRIGNFYLLANQADEARKKAELVLAAEPNRADAHMLLAQVLLRENKPDETVAEFDKAISLDPSNVEQRLAKATALWGLGRLDASRQALEEILAKDGSHAGALLLLAQVADLQGDRQTVDQTFDRLLKAKPDNPVVWMTYGSFWVTKGDIPRALEAYAKAGEVEKLGTAGWEKYAELSLDRRDYAGASKAVEAIYAKSDKSVTGKFYEGRILLGERNFEEASGRFEQVVHEYPNHPEAHYFLALAHYSLGNLQTARAELRKALQIKPDFYKAKMLLAEAHLVSRDFEQAIQETDDLVKGPKVHPEAVLIRGSALMGQGKNPQARELLEALAKAAPKFPRVQERLGLCYLAEKMPGEALAAFDRALEVDPRNLTALTLTTQVLASEKKPDAAVARVRANIEKAGDSAGARELLGQIYRANGDATQARTELEKAIELDPNAAGAYLLLAQLHPFPSGVKDAIADLDKATQKQPRHFQAWMMKGVLHSLLRQVKEAEQAYRKALEINPDSAAVLNELAWNLTENGGNIDEALKFAQRAVELAPKSALFNDTLGWIYVKKGVPARAANHLESAAEILRENPEVHYHLGKAYAGMGEKGKAAAALKKALELSEKFPGAEDAKETLKGLGG